MYDLKTPSDSYEKERQKLRNQIRITEDNSDLPANKKKKEKERCTALMEKLTEVCYLVDGGPKTLFCSEERFQLSNIIRLLHRRKRDKRSTQREHSTFCGVKK